MRGNVMIIIYASILLFHAKMLLKYLDLIASVTNQKYCLQYRLYKGTDDLFQLQNRRVRDS